MSRLRDDEQRLVNDSKRCLGCGHLDLFHSTYHMGRDENYQRVQSAGLHLSSYPVRGGDYAGRIHQGKTMKKVLGIDPGTHTGWAVCHGEYDDDKLWRTGRIVASGVESFADVADKGYGAMFVAFRALLRNLHRNHGPFAAIAYELPFLRGPVASRILWGMAAHVQERCAMWRCVPLPVNTMTLKKFATGSGKAGKPEMIRAAIGCRLGATLMGEHEADAIHVARWGVAQLRSR